MMENKERLDLALRSAQAGTWSWDVDKDIYVWDAYMHQFIRFDAGFGDAALFSCAEYDLSRRQR